MRAAKLLVAVLCLLLPALLPTTSDARDERQWQRQYCAGMKLEQHLDYGGYVDCLSPQYAIEVEWANKWEEAVGQSLYYAARTDRKPGIILLCEQSEGHVEGLCRSYIYRLAEAFKFVNTHVYVWMCHIDKDKTLNDCDHEPVSTNAGATIATR